MCEAMEGERRGGRERVNELMDSLHFFSLLLQITHIVSSIHKCDSILIARLMSLSSAKPCPATEE